MQNKKRNLIVLVLLWVEHHVLHVYDDYVRAVELCYLAKANTFHLLTVVYPIL